MGNLEKEGIGSNLLGDKNCPNLEKGFGESGVGARLDRVHDGFGKHGKEFQPKGLVTSAKMMEIALREIEGFVKHEARR